MTLQKLKRSCTSIKFIDKNIFLIGSECLKAVFCNDVNDVFSVF